MGLAGGALISLVQCYKLICMRRRNIAIYAFLGSLVITGILFFVLNMTNPSDGGPAVILLVLVLIYALAYGLIVLMAMLFGYVYRLIAPKQPTTTMSAERYARRLRKQLAICGVLAATPILIISLNSIGRMDFIDGLLIVATESLAVFYLVKKM